MTQVTKAQAEIVTERLAAARLSAKQEPTASLQRLQRLQTINLPLLHNYTTQTDIILTLKLFVPVLSSALVSIFPSPFIG